jgi:hypothetical protein
MKQIILNEKQAYSVIEAIDIAIRSGGLKNAVHLVPIFLDIKAQLEMKPEAPKNVD